VQPDGKFNYAVCADGQLAGESMIRFVVALFLGLCSVAHAQGPVLPGPGLPVAAGGSAATLNPSDKGANATLSGGDLTVTNTVLGRANVRSTTSHSSGKYYVEFSVVSGSGSFDTGYGIANSSASLTVGIGSPDANSTAIYLGGNTIYIANASSGTDGVPAVGGVTCLAIDLDNNTIWYRLNGGNWNGSGVNDPATNTGGRSISGIAGPFFVIVSAAKSGANNAVVTVNFGGSAYAFTAPSGFGVW
jgi:hypothetical protein